MIFEIYLYRLKCGNIALCEYRIINRIKHEKGNGREGKKVDFRYNKNGKKVMATTYK